MFDLFRYSTHLDLWYGYLHAVQTSASQQPMHTKQTKLSSWFQNRYAFQQIYTHIRVSAENAGSLAVRASNAELPINHRDSHGRSALLLACYMGQLDCARALLDTSRDIDIDQPDDNGRCVCVCMSMYYMFLVVICMPYIVFLYRHSQ